MTSPNAISRVNSGAAWPSLFKRLPHDLDRLIASCFNSKDLKTLCVCKSWRKNPCLIALKEKAWVEWRKDQAILREGFPLKLVQVFRKHNISLWDVPTIPISLADSEITPEQMPKVNKIPCSVARFNFGCPGIYLSLKGHAEGYIWGPSIIDLGNGLFMATQLSIKEISGVIMLRQRHITGANMGTFWIAHTEPVQASSVLSVAHPSCAGAISEYCPQCPSIRRGNEAIFGIADELLSEKDLCFRLANREVTVLPKDSPLISSQIPLTPPGAIPKPIPGLIDRLFSLISRVFRCCPPKANPQL